MIELASSDTESDFDDPSSIASGQRTMISALSDNLSFLQSSLSTDVVVDLDDLIVQEEEVGSKRTHGGRQLDGNAYIPEIYCQKFTLN